MEESASQVTTRVFQIERAASTKALRQERGDCLAGAKSMLNTDPKLLLAPSLAPASGWGQITATALLPQVSCSDLQPCPGQARGTAAEARGQGAWPWAQPCEDRKSQHALTKNPWGSKASTGTV